MVEISLMSIGHSILVRWTVRCNMYKIKLTQSPSFDKKRFNFILEIILKDTLFQIIEKISGALQNTL